MYTELKLYFTGVKRCNMSVVGMNVLQHVSFLALYARLFMINITVLPENQQVQQTTQKRAQSK